MNADVRRGLGLVVVALIVWLVGRGLGGGVASTDGQQQVAELVTGAGILLGIGGLAIVAAALFRTHDRGSVDSRRE